MYLIPIMAKVFEDWPSCGNMFDGFTHWSKYSGRGKMIMDGDFIRLNTFGSDAERKVSFLCNSWRVVR